MAGVVQVGGVGVDMVTGAVKVKLRIAIIQGTEVDLRMALMLFEVAIRAGVFVRNEQTVVLLANFVVKTNLSPIALSQKFLDAFSSVVSAE
jgi:hypothetical protein